MKVLYTVGYIFVIIGFCQIYSWSRQNFYQYLSTSLMISGAIFIAIGHGVNHIVQAIEGPEQDYTSCENCRSILSEKEIEANLCKSCGKAVII